MKFLIGIFSILLIVGIGEASAELSDPINITFNTFSGARENVFYDSQLDFCTLSDNSNINTIASNAVKDWQDSLVRLTGNDVWNMSVFSNPASVEFCDVIIEYQKTPTLPKQFLIGMAGYVNPVSPTITIFTENYQKTLSENGPISSLEKFEEIVLNSKHEQLSDEELSKTIKHEIGHILGATHKESCSCLMDENPESSEITIIDILEVIRSYPNGFVDSNYDLKFELGKKYETKKYFVGDQIEIDIEIPITNYKIPDISLYIFPDGRDVKTKNAQVKIHNEEGMRGIFDQDDHFSKIEMVNGHSYYTDKGTFSTMKIKLQPQMEMSQADILIKIKEPFGIEKQYMLNDVMVVEEGLFSNLNLDTEKYFQS